MTNRAAVLASAIAVAVALLDGGLKSLAIAHLPDDTQPMAWPFALALHKNPGVIFDIAVPLEIILPITAILCVALSIAAKRRYAKSPAQSAALGWIVCGATGNAVDRLVNHFTTDYLIFFRRSAINLSDILIVAGAIAYLYYSRDRLPEDTTH